MNAMVGRSRSGSSLASSSPRSSNEPASRAKRRASRFGAAHRRRPVLAVIGLAYALPARIFDSLVTLLYNYLASWLSQAVL